MNTVKCAILSHQYWTGINHEQLARIDEGGLLAGLNVLQENNVIMVASIAHNQWPTSRLAPPPPSVSVKRHLLLAMTKLLHVCPTFYTACAV